MVITKDRTQAESIVNDFFSKIDLNQSGKVDYIGNLGIFKILNFINI